MILKKIKVLKKKDIEPLSQKVKGNSYHTVTLNKQIESGSEEEEGGFHTTNYTPPQDMVLSGVEFPLSFIWPRSWDEYMQGFFLNESGGKMETYQKR